MVMDDATVDSRDSPGAVPYETRVWAWGEQIFEAAPNGLLLIGCDDLIVRVNGELCAIFGYERHELLGQSLQILLPERHRAAHPTQLARYREQPEKRLMGAGRDLYGRRRTGEEFPVEIGLNPIVIAGETMILASVVDISEQRRLEGLFRQIVEAAPEGMVMIDSQGIITLANRRLCGLFGYPMEDIVGKPIEHLLPPRYRGGHVPLRNAFIADPELRPMGSGRDLTAQHADGSEFPVEIGLTPITTADGPMVLASITDITLRKQSEHQLKQVNAGLEEFTSVASHDLRSPLRGIASLLDWIEEDIGETPPAVVTEHIERARIRVKRMESLISDLLNYARAGQVSEQVEPIDIAAMVDDVLALSASHAGFTFETNLAVAQIVGSRTPIATCLRNLVGNAIKHHDRGNRHIGISCVEEDGYCVFRVSDDGPGIPPNVHHKVFKLFQTLNKNSTNGTGLGLAITKRLVENHGGSIALHSDKNTRGTTFVLRWPMFHRRDLERKELHDR